MPTRLFNSIFLLSHLAFCAWAACGMGCHMHAGGHLEPSQLSGGDALRSPARKSPSFTADGVEFRVRAVRSALSVFIEIRMANIGDEDRLVAREPDAYRGAYTENYVDTSGNVATRDREVFMMRGWVRGGTWTSSGRDAAQATESRRGLIPENDRRPPFGPDTFVVLGAGEVYLRILGPFSVPIEVVAFQKVYLMYNQYKYGSGNAQKSVCGEIQIDDLPIECVEKTGGGE